jgi:ubiquinone/menaquinone biosynthesis C-methylase UbiE
MNRNKYFNQASNTWEDKYHSPKLEVFINKLIPKIGIKPGHVILDVGTGTGILIPFLLQAVGPSGSITAIDYAEQMITKCRSNYSHLRNVTIAIQDIENLTLPSESFDAVTCFRVFPHLERKAKALGHLNRVLKHGGKLIIAHAHSSTELKKVHRSSECVADDCMPEAKFMKRMLNNAGFGRIHIDDKPGYYLCLSQKN